MKAKLAALLAVFILFFSGCGASPTGDIACTTLPVYAFTQRLCELTPLTVTRLVTEQVSCLHDYSLNVRQVKAAEGAGVVVISGGGLEAFMEDLLPEGKRLDASAGIAMTEVLEPHSHEGESHEGHHHDLDPHIWLDPRLAKTMVSNISAGLSLRYPQYQDIFQANEEALLAELDALFAYGERTLGDLKCRQLITFHDGFSYFASAFQLTIVEAVEEESGSEASAKELIHLIETVQENSLPAIFTEKSGSASAAGVIARETGCAVFQLDMAMSGDSYFDAMYHNIDTIKEALG